MAWGMAYLVSLIGVASHLALDLTNVYGVRLLLPFSDRWLRLDLNSILDPWIMAALLLAVLAPALSKLVDAMKETHGRLASILATRGNKLPATFDEEAWAELPTAHVSAGSLPAPVQMEPSRFSFSPEELVVHQDDAQGDKASWEQTKDAWVLTYATGGGWGLHGDLPLEQLSIGGAQTIEVEFTAPAGLPIQVLLQETGDGPPGRQVYNGKNGADGESYELPVFIATGNRQVVRLRLTDAERRLYWGNQNGNMTLDTQGLRAMSFLIRNGQGSGELRIYRVSFAGAD